MSVPPLNPSLPLEQRREVCVLDIQQPTLQTDTEPTVRETVLATRSSGIETHATKDKPAFTPHAFKNPTPAASYRRDTKSISNKNLSSCQNPHMPALKGTPRPCRVKPRRPPNRPQIPQTCPPSRCRYVAGTSS